LDRGLDAGDHLPLDRPGPGGVAERAEAADLRRGAGHPAEGCVVGKRRGPGQQHLVAAEAEDVADPVALQPGHRLGSAVVAVAANQDVHGRPMAADRAHDMAQHESYLGPVRGLALPQDDGHRLAAAGLVDVDRQKAAAVVVGMEQGQLLTAVNPILGIVDVEHDPARHLVKAITEEPDHRSHHALERRRTG